ncbi:MAG: MFS transporter [Boseongicola sp.]
MEKVSVRAATFLIMSLFCLQPMVIGSWLALIPHVKETIGLSKSELAVALLGMPSALLVALQIAGRTVARFGVRRLFLYAFPLQAIASLFPILAPSQIWLFVGLAVFGSAVAFMEVALNVYAGRMEKAAGRLIMNRCHGFWALGLMFGSALATGIAPLSTPLMAMMFIAFASALVGVAMALQLPKFGEIAVGQAPPRRQLRDLPLALLAIGSFMLTVTLAEGAMADWSAVYLSERMSSGLTEAGIAVTVFSGFMAVARFSGDILKRQFGAVNLARGSVALAIAGLLLLILPLPIAVAYVGFAFVGLGVASGYPLGVSAVAALDDTHEAANVALMSTFALTGFLIGPPVIGFLAEAFSLRIGFAALIPALLLCLYLAGWLRNVAAPGSTTRRQSQPLA